MTAAQILLNIGDASTFETAGHLAAHAGISLVTRRSCTSIRGEFPARSGNKRLKNVLFYYAWVAWYNNRRLHGTFSILIPVVTNNHSYQRLARE